MRVLIVIIEGDEDAKERLLVFKDFRAFEKDARARGIDQGSDWLLIRKLLQQGESFADKTTYFGWFNVLE